MRLSEAIRLGAMARPQTCEGKLLHDGATCAMGAAADAIGRLSDADADGNYDLLRRVWPILEMQVQHPTDTYPHRDELLDMIFFLNDTDEWTREQIADWVETLESAQEPPATERTPDEVFAVARIDRT